MYIRTYVCKTIILKTWLDNVNCAGTELSIEYYSHNGWENENCGHHEVKINEQVTFT